jgi:tRNA-splicing ligase RtcB (3'-phosphate/5'-hydroxy nucleic acid ligase)
MAYTEYERGGKPFKVWDDGGKVPMEPNAIAQMGYVSQLPIVKGLALMADAHVGQGCTVGAIVCTSKALIPATVGVDVGCGVAALRTSLTSKQISENGQDLFEAISRAVPHGFDKNGRDGNWGDIPEAVGQAWSEMEPDYRKIVEQNGRVSSKNAVCQLGTLGSGNHVCSVNIDEEDRIWLLLHSGSRGLGNRVGQFFIEAAKKEMEKLGVKLPHPSKDLEYLSAGTAIFDQYVEALMFAQNYARTNRRLMIDAAVKAMKKVVPVKFTTDEEMVACHHNYAAIETVNGEELYITRKGAVSAREGENGIILGCMGGKSYITRGKGSKDSFQSCSHGAGRVMSRTEAKKTITLDMHRKATEGCYCRKDKGVIDESPASYKNIDAVMAAQTDLVDVVHCLQEIVCVKG